MRYALVLFVISIGLLWFHGVSTQAGPQAWKYEWPKTDFSKTLVDLDEIMSGGPVKDGIPAIDSPQFVSVSNAKHVSDKEPVISVAIGEEARAYPVSVLMYHEIVNDQIGDVPISVTYCPLCNASMVYGRRLGNRVLDFGTTGKLRHSDMVMYDRQTETWWQQFIGKAIVGELAGEKLKILPSKIESFASFKKYAHKIGKVLVPNDEGMRPYGRNPYIGYDSSNWPFLYKGNYEEDIPPLAYVVMVGKDAWPLELLKKKKRITYETAEDVGQLVLRWEEGQHSALDAKHIRGGRDIGNVFVYKQIPISEGDSWDQDKVPYSVPFAFAFKAFHPDGIIHTK